MYRALSPTNICNIAADSLHTRDHQREMLARERQLRIFGIRRVLPPCSQCGIPVEVHVAAPHREIIVWKEQRTTREQGRMLHFEHIPTKIRTRLQTEPLKLVLLVVEIDKKIEGTVGGGRLHSRYVHQHGRDGRAGKFVDRCTITDILLHVVIP